MLRRLRIGTCAPCGGIAKTNPLSPMNRRIFSTIDHRAPFRWQATGSDQRHVNRDAASRCLRRKQTHFVEASLKILPDDMARGAPPLSPGCHSSCPQPRHELRHRPLSRQRERGPEPGRSERGDGTMRIGIVEIEKNKATSSCPLESRYRKNKPT